MTKQEFKEELRKRLSGLPKRELEERLSFYSEMIDDRIEEGLSEDDAIKDLGGTDKVAAEIIRDIPLSKIAAERIKPKNKLGALEITLIALGSPLWITLAAAALVIVISIYAVIWSVLASLWAVFASLAACGPAGLIAGLIFIFSGNALSGVFALGAGILCAGLAILFFFLCILATKGIIWLSREIMVGIKNLFIKKENA